MDRRSPLGATQSSTRSTYFYLWEWGIVVGPGLGRSSRNRLYVLIGEKSLSNEDQDNLLSYLESSGIHDRRTTLFLSPHFEDFTQRSQSQQRAIRTLSHLRLHLYLFYLSGYFRPLESKQTGWAPRLSIGGHWGKVESKNEKDHRKRMKERKSESGVAKKGRRNGRKEGRKDMRLLLVCLSLRVASSLTDH